MLSVESNFQNIALNTAPTNALQKAVENFRLTAPGESYISEWGKDHRLLLII